MVAFLLFLNLAFGQATATVPSRFADGKPVDVSIISKERADKLFEELRKLPNVPFQHPYEGCYARATTMALHAEKQGILFAKVYIHGTLRVATQSKKWPYVHWRWHVSPVAYVTDHGKTELMVFDPSLFSKPVTIEELRTKITPPEIPKGFEKTKITDMYFGSRFQYYSTIDDKYPKTAWHFKDLSKAITSQETIMNNTKIWARQVGADAMNVVLPGKTFPKPEFGVFPPTSPGAESKGAN